MYSNHNPTYSEHEYENSILKVLLNEENDPQKKIGFRAIPNLDPLIN